MQYSRQDCLKVVKIPSSILSDTQVQVFDKLGFYVEGKDIQACHRLRDKDKAIVKSSNRKDSLQILHVKKYFKSLDPTELDFPESARIFINKSLCAVYRGLWNKCQKLKDMDKLNVFFAANGKIKVKMLKNDPVKHVTHAVDLKKNFPGIDIDKFVVLFVGISFLS